MIFRYINLSKIVDILILTRLIGRSRGAVIRAPVQRSLDPYIVF
jgi:hypothetical protein